MSNQEVPEVPIEELLSSNLSHEEQAAIGLWAHNLSNRVTELELKLSVVSKELERMQQHFFLGGA